MRERAAMEVAFYANACRIETARSAPHFAPQDMASPFPRLFEPIRLGTRESRNRIMRLATTTNTGENGVATEHTVALYRRIARGGAGIVVTESMRVHPSNAGRDHAMLLYRKEIVPSLTRVAETVRAEGALFIVQLNHGGRQHHASEIPTLWAPSAVACPHSGGVPHEVSKAEIADVVKGFATAALHAKQAGCDGVEIHGAQGHLIQEFVSPFSNQRQDEYGGSLDNRLRFAREIVAAVREKVGNEFIVGYRMGVEEFTPGGITIEESKEAARRLTAMENIDYLSLAQGNFNTIDTHLPDSHYPPLTFVDLHAQIKAAVPGMAIVTSSRIRMPEEGEAIIAAGKADIIGLCRALIADPEWPEKAMRGQSEDIVRCICCNRCWSGVVANRRLACSVNPTVGFETELPALTRTDRPKRVVVIGGGPGGLEAARTASEKGHRVILFEKSSKLGGKLVLARHFQPYHESSYAADDLSRQVAKLGVDIRMATEATRESVMAERPDAVVVATGADVYAPAVAGDGSIPVVTYSRLPAGATVLVMDEDGYYWASCMTEALARRGCKVMYVTRFLEPLRELPEVTRISTLRALDELGVKLLCNMQVDRVEGGTVVLRHYYNPRREERLANIGEVVWVGAQRANDRLARELHEMGLAYVHLIGDAYAPRRLGNAIAEGHRAARSI